MYDASPKHQTLYAMSYSSPVPPHPNMVIASGTGTGSHPKPSYENKTNCHQKNYSNNKKIYLWPLHYEAPALIPQTQTNREPMCYCLSSYCLLSYVINLIYITHFLGISIYKIVPDRTKEVALSYRSQRHLLHISNETGHNFMIESSAKELIISHMQIGISGKLKKESESTASTCLKKNQTDKLH